MARNKRNIRNEVKKNHINEKKFIECVNIGVEKREEDWKILTN